MTPWRRDVACQELVELLTAYLDGALPGRVRRAVDRHLARCPECVEYVAQFRRSVDAVHRLAGTPPDAVLDALSAALAEERTAYVRSEGTGSADGGESGPG